MSGEHYDSALAAIEDENERWHSTIRKLPDQRCLSFPDRPYSAFCSVCWHNVYALWLDKSWHENACIDGHSRPQDCREARNRDFASMQIARARRGLPALPLPPDPEDDGEDLVEWE